MRKILSALLLSGVLGGLATAAEPRPNILVCLADDQSWPHASAYGEPVIKTPAFDRVAKVGALFSQVYCAAPSCTASRSAILTGQDIWRLGEGAQLFGTLPAKYPVYTDLLAESGYCVGYMLKGWGPGSDTAGGRKSNPAGPLYKNFAEFFEKAPKGKPWCFWLGSHYPHRPYKKGSGVQAGLDPAKVRVPAFLPDTLDVRGDLCDYFLAIQRFDQQVSEILDQLEQSGQLDNTLIVVTSDNGMPFPRAKANIYDSGMHMPMAICWPKRMSGGRKIDDFVNLADLAPTFLEAAGVGIRKDMTGHSLMGILTSRASGIIDPKRDAVITGRERHAWCRVGGLGYPGRMIRTRDYLYIRNYQPDRWPAGDYRMVTNEGHYGDIDNSPSKNFILDHKEESSRFFDLSVSKRPLEELYDCRADPNQFKNLAADPGHREILRKMSDRLTAYLKASGDPRETTDEAPWDNWKYYGKSDWKVIPD